MVVAAFVVVVVSLSVRGSLFLPRALRALFFVLWFNFFARWSSNSELSKVLDLWKRSVFEPNGVTWNDEFDPNESVLEDCRR